LQLESELQFSKVKVVFSRLDDIEPTDQKRFHINKDEIIRLKECTIVLSREWNYINILNFIQAAISLGYKIDKASSD